MILAPRDDFGQNGSRISSSTAGRKKRKNRHTADPAIVGINHLCAFICCPFAPVEFFPSASRRQNSGQRTLTLTLDWFEFDSIQFNPVQSNRDSRPILRLPVRANQRASNLWRSSSSRPELRALLWFGRQQQQQQRRRPVSVFFWMIKIINHHLNVCCCRCCISFGVAQPGKRSDDHTKISHCPSDWRSS